MKDINTVKKVRCAAGIRSVVFVLEVKKKLFYLVQNLTEVPMTILGGVGKFEDTAEVIKRYKIIGTAAGSLFIFLGKYRVVLISYPNIAEREKLY